MSVANAKQQMQNLAPPIEYDENWVNKLLHETPEHNNRDNNQTTPCQSQLLLEDIMKIEKTFNRSSKARQSSQTGLEKPVMPLPLKARQGSKDKTSAIEKQIRDFSIKQQMQYRASDRLTIALPKKTRAKRLISYLKF
jgi:hypothetical protein